MHKNISVIFSLFLLVGDFLAILLAFVSAYIIRVKFDDRPLVEQISSKEYFTAIILVIPLWIMTHFAIGLYQKSIYNNRFKELGKLIIGSFIGILLVIGWDFIVPKNLFPARLVPIYAFALSLGFLIIFRTFARIARKVLQKRKWGQISILIIGSSSASSDLIEYFTDRKDEYRILGIVGAKSNPHKIREFSSLDSAVDELGVKNIHSILVIELSNNAEDDSKILEFAQINHIAYQFVPGNNEIMSGQIEVELVHDTPVVSVHQTSLLGWGRIVKRLFDVSVSVTLLVLLSPVFLVISILQKMAEPSADIFFKQTRVTRFHEGFKLIKFRTAKAKYNGLTPEEAFTKMGKPHLIEKYRNNGDQLENDPRYGRFHKFLRSTSLDELPQIWNVLVGDLSLVGPRALIPKEIGAYNKKHHILSVKSGITGLAQVSGRKDIDFEERRRLDVYYVQNWSFWLDISILVRTIRVV
ncbi:MAG: exopolysaccharide biosynthesis polyprenyl glycosylphosphotransferase, partial [Patescibacteria group bacterium]